MTLVRSTCFKAVSLVDDQDVLGMTTSPPRGVAKSSQPLIVKDVVVVVATDKSAEMEPPLGGDGISHGTSTMYPGMVPRNRSNCTSHGECEWR